MGVRSLKTFIFKNSPHVIKRGKLKELAGSTIAIDAPCMINKLRLRWVSDFSKSLKIGNSTESRDRLLKVFKDGDWKKDWRSYLTKELSHTFRALHAVGCRTILVNEGLPPISKRRVIIRRQAYRDSTRLKFTRVIEDIRGYDETGYVGEDLYDEWRLVGNIHRPGISTEAPDSRGSPSQDVEISKAAGQRARISGGAAKNITTETWDPNQLTSGAGEWITVTRRKHRSWSTRPDYNDVDPTSIGDMVISSKERTAILKRALKRYNASIPPDQGDYRLMNKIAVCYGGRVMSGGCEAETLCAALVTYGVADLTMSCDTDALVYFGGKKVLFDISPNSGSYTYFDRTTFKQFLRVNSEVEFLTALVMCGTDYNMPVKIGINPLLAVNQLRTVLSNIKADTRRCVPTVTSTGGSSSDKLRVKESTEVDEQQEEVSDEKILLYAQAGGVKADVIRLYALKDLYICTESVESCLTRSRLSPIPSVKK